MLKEKAEGHSKEKTTFYAGTLLVSLVSPPTLLVASLAAISIVQAFVPSFLHSPVGPTVIVLLMDAEFPEQGVICVHVPHALLPDFTL